jgi:AraC-like DNA-binding protein
LRRAATTTEFLSNPIGAYFAGRHHSAFAYSPRILGFSSWGRPDVEDVRELLRLCTFALRPELAPYLWLVDLRGLEVIEPATFAPFVEYTRRNRQVLGQKILKQAQLRPDGFVGAIIAGFGHVASLPYPNRVFGDPLAAIAWLEVEPSEGASVVAELEAIRNDASAGVTVVARLRREFAAAGALTIKEAARRLATSTRSLQRALRDAGTSYRAELESFRLRRAQELLRSERSVTWIAAELGFSSAQHLATAYRRAMGETPTAWRARNRKSA